MRTTTVTVLSFILIGTVGCGSRQEVSMTYTNPVLDVNCADPSVVFHDGTWYLYPTRGGRSYRVFTSPDLVDWTEGPVVYEPEGRDVWAPEVYRHPEDGAWYLYSTIHHTVGVARADGPLGPFRPVADLVPKAIDGYLFRDEDGGLYLFYVKWASDDQPYPFTIWVQPMASPVKPQGDPVRLLGPTEPWELQPSPITEAPCVFRHGDRYYMLYSGSPASGPDYAVGYATAASPTGPFVKSAENPVVKRGDGIYGPGHGCVVRDGAGALWHVYHQKLADDQGWARRICIDRIRIDDDGRLHSRATRGEVLPAPAPR